MSKEVLIDESIIAGKVLILQKKWEFLRCNCDSELTLIEDNDFEEIKECQKCGKKYMLVKKMRKNLMGG